MPVRIIFLGLLPLLLLKVAFGQPREIPSQDYFDAYSTAINTVLGHPRRHMQKIELFEKSRTISTVEQIEEVQDRNTRRSVYLETNSSRQVRKETIQIDGVYYCRSGKGTWKKLRSDCFAMGAQIARENSEGETHYSTEQVTLDSKPLTVLRQYVLFPTSRNKLEIWENRIWIDRDYLIVRREFESGVRNGSRTHVIETYEYDPKLKIGPPIR